MSLTAQGNSRLPTKIKKPNLYATHTHAQTHAPMCEKKITHDHRGTLTYTQSKKHNTQRQTHTDTTEHTHTHTHTGANTYKHHNNLFFKKRQEQMIQMKGAKLRAGMCLHSLTTF